MNTLKKNSSIPDADTLSSSKFFKGDVIQTHIPILNVAFGGGFDCGLSSGVTMIAGESATFKTGFLIQFAKSFQEKYKDGVVIFYDSEFSPIHMWESAGVDMDRVHHAPIKHVEELKIDLVKQLNGLEEHHKVLVLVDSIGGLASLKELTDAGDGKTTADMSRAKALASLFRMVPPLLNMKDIPMVMINSFYQTMELYPKRVYAGGKKLFLASDEVFFISKSKEKDGKELVGNHFKLTADKSRSIKELSQFTVDISFENGINKYSGLFELAVESGKIIQSGAWYQTIDKNGEVAPKKQRRTDIECPEYFVELLKDKEFCKYVEDKYIL